MQLRTAVTDIFQVLLLRFPVCICNCSLSRWRKEDILDRLRLSPPRPPARHLRSSAFDIKPPPAARFRFSRYKVVVCLSSSLFSLNLKITVKMSPLEGADDLR